MCKLRYYHCSDETTKYVNLKVSENDVKLKLSQNHQKYIDFLEFVGVLWKRTSRMDRNNIGNFLMFDFSK